ncbi:TonB-dependent receptor [Psychrosphaera saromensis]|uniref:TonB-dependent receptor n=2 Tax=Psychrosphaera saromensis TaxID=716813 RepID=A0A2S7UTS4_9GAMM|nr:TonB-dependent receptor [Psychrosphaera saromensis]PQJ53347.1 TonB-dependent receptor [Psychrosphaera saromensis]
MKMKNKNGIFKLSLLNTALISAIALSSTTALANSDMSGRITDAKNSVYFGGAKVTIEELNLTTISKRDGSFHFDNLPVGEYTLVINYVGTDELRKKLVVTSDEPINNNYVIGDVENVIVYGQRAGQAGALNRQKNANRLISVVSADSIGQLPDQNAAEALQRLPGLSIQRDQGEGRFVTIRGIDPNLNNVTINGLNVPSPEAGVRSVAMDVIPSELISSLEVSKTVTPDMDANAVGGSIEVKSLSAFDREGKSYSVTAQTSYNELVEEVSPKLSGSYSDIFTLNNGYELGIAGAVSWRKREFGSENVETDGGWSEIEVEDAATGDDVEIFGAEEIEQRLYRIERERVGVALNLDLYTSVTDSYYVRSFFSQFSDDEYRIRNEYKLDKGEIDLTSYSETSAQYSNAEMDRDTKDRYETQEITSIVAGGENKIDSWLLEYQLGYSKSTEEEPDRLDVSFNGEDLDLGYLSSGEVPELTQSANAHDLSNFALDEIVAENNLAEDEETSFRVDITKSFIWNNNSGEFKFGGKYSTREKTNSVLSNIYDGGFDDLTAEDFNGGSVDFSLGSFGDGLSREGIQQFVSDNKDNFERNDLESEIETKGNSYNSSEDVFAAYAMVTLDIDKWQVITGLRYEGSEFATKGNQVELLVDEINDDESVAIDSWEVSKDYDYFLPSLNVRYAASKKLIARFAYTQTIARPTFDDSAAFQVIETEMTDDDGEIEIERKAEVGNPDLDPYESQNLDFSVHYYPGYIGVISAGVFYKDIDNYIIYSEVQENGEWDGFEEVIQPVNGGTAELTGLELAWNKTFDSGLLLGANGTFVDASSGLPNQSDTIANLMLGFENNTFSTRLSASYKSNVYQFDENDAGVFEDDHAQLDFSSKYHFSDSIQFYFNASNLTDEPMYLYHGVKQFNYQYEQYGRTFEFGIKINSL